MASVRAQIPGSQTTHAEAAQLTLHWTETSARPERARVDDATMPADRTADET